ncbi:uncharacterized protein KZ484_007952 [Pholidichthys leucotaenia]
MLAEGFLNVMAYSEEKRLASTSTSTRNTRKTGGGLAESDPFNSILSDSSSADPEQHSAETELNQEVQGLKGTPQRPVSLSIPTAAHPALIEDCSLLEQYPDLQVADSGRISHHLLRTACIQSEASIHPEPTVQQETQNNPVSPMSDQGYLVMGASENISMDLPGSQLEPMSNSLLNGLLEKQLEEVYMQHLTDNLARCHSHLANSLLHGLVPPPSQGPDLLGSSLEEPKADSNNTFSYRNTHKSVPCSSNFSSPVLRISERENPHPQ